MIVFSGSSNKPLVKKLAGKLGVKLGKVELSRFANGEVRVFVKEKIENEVAIVVQSLSTPPDLHLVEFCLICDALERMGSSKIIGVIPWLGYSKQDRVFRSGEPLSVKVIAKMLQVVPLDQVVTFDLHNPSILGFFEVPVVNLSTRLLFLDHFNKLNKDKLLVVAPDAGAIKNSTAFARGLGVAVAYIDKERDLESGKVLIRGISKGVGGKNVVMIDDMIATGSTLIESVKFLKKEEAGKIFIAATHHLFLPGVQKKIEKVVDNLVITDTIRKPEGLELQKTKVISCVALISEVL